MVGQLYCPKTQKASHLPGQPGGQYVNDAAALVRSPVLVGSGSMSPVLVGEGNGVTGSEQFPTVVSSPKWELPVVLSPEQS